MKLKVCGLSNPVEVEICVRLNVDYCGFILNYPKSHRYISLEKAKMLTNIKKKKTNFVRDLVEKKIKEIKKYTEIETLPVLKLKKGFYLIY